MIPDFTLIRRSLSDVKIRIRVSFLHAFETVLEIRAMKLFALVANDEVSVAVRGLVLAAETHQEGIFYFIWC